MKIVQSFWSKPYLKYREGSETSPELQFTVLSWCFSCLKLSQFYQDLELVTDTRGKKMLVDILELPYTRISTQLDEIDHYDPDLYSVGKIITYSMQREPFVHVDGDVFIWERLPSFIENASLIGQNFEFNFPRYREITKLVNAKLAGLNNEWCVDHRNIWSINMGIAGGSNVDFFIDYSASVLAFIKLNSEAICSFRHQEKLLFNMFYEQVYYYQLIKSKGAVVDVLFHEMDSTYDLVRRFDGLRPLTSYIHLLGSSKTESKYHKLVEQMLANEFPEFYGTLAKKNVILQKFLKN